MRFSCMRATPVILLISCAFQFACTTFEKSETVTPYQVDESFKPQRVDITTPVEFHMAPPVGRIDVAHVTSRSLTKTRSNNQLLHEREENVDFSVKTEVKSIDAKTGDRTVLVETVRKDGPVDLYDVGYPEVGETLEYIYTTKALVKKAGHFPENSMFFLPPIALPKKAVSVGDTWKMDAQWVALRNGLPMSVEVISIFKAVYKCGVQHQCAEVEISGEVKVPEGLTKSAALQSTLAGRLLFDLNSGAILWSDIRNVEKLAAGDDQMEIFSCTEALLEEPEQERWPWRAQVGCDPQQPVPGTIPGIKL
jgi:hypothetical protein